jgi:DNA-binding CsgD family transcriptional regulator/tetratricopeptide (TPR) repeat protein
MADVLIERSAFLASLEGLLGEALDSSGRLVFLGGEAGVGKTTLAAALADAALTVRRGSCDNVTTAEALGPILDALPELAAAIDRAEGVSRLRLFRRVRDELSASPMLLLLEDVHWADEATLDILRYLGRRLAGTRLMILATFRSEEVGREHPLTVVMGELAGLPGVVRMQLPPFSVTGVRQLLHATGSALDAAAIFQLTGGNPFYVTEVIAAGSGQVPGTVRDAVLARVSRLSPAGREVAAAASVLGRRAEAGLLAAVSGQPLTAVDDCVARGVLAVDEDAVGFRHDLARLAVERSLLPAQRSAAHARTLAELTSRGSHDHRRLAYHAAGCGDQAAAAVRTLESLEPGPELAMAYSNLAQLRMLADDFEPAVRWGTRAAELARRLGDRDTEMHALNNVGTALASGGDMLEGSARLTQSLDLALAGDAHEHAARAFTNLGSTHVLSWSLGEADRHLKAGITYCADRDLDTWRRYMTAWLARSLAGQGQYATAERHLADVLRDPHVSPITQVSALPVIGVLEARRGRDRTGALDEALAIAVRTGESMRLVPVAAARAEAAWIAGCPEDLVADVDRAWAVAVAHPQPWELGELSWWLLLAGDRRPLPAPPASPFALMLAGEHRAAAAEWEGLGCPLWSAYALAFSPELRDAQQCLDVLGRLDVPAVRRAVLRDRRALGLALPRGPRPASRAHPAGLTARETEVLQLLADGLSYAEVADRLVLSEKTVGHHVSAILRKLREPTRSRAVATALRLGVVPPR